MPDSTLPTYYQQFIHLSRYARWVDGSGRRETWKETVDRYMDFMCDVQCKDKIDRETRKELRDAILHLEVMPSMRCMMTAGEALKRDAVAGYNCSYIAIDNPSAFDEMLYILMCLAPDTMIRTELGCKPISQLTLGDRVLSRKDSGEYEYVSPSFVGETPSAAKKKIELEFEDGYIVRVTEDHLFQTNRGWVKAKDLTESDEIQNYHEVSKLVRKIEITDNRNYWDMTVPVNHNFVLANGIVVHNCGAGVGFSVERQFIAKLPVVVEKLHQSKTTIKVEDSRLGWANGLRELIIMLFQGRIPEWDLSEIRPAGAKLKTFGGRASGPEPLNDLFKFCVETFKEAAGRRLNSIECHDICCKIGEVVVAGGVRRSALISLSNPSDDRMRYAKSGNWNDVTPWRAMSNNSVCYTEKPGMDVFFREWLALYESKSGERGIFNREAAKKQVAKNGRRDPNYEFGCNPCSEIILRSDQFCNLTEVVVRKEDSEKSLKRKVRLATILGTMQATLTHFHYLNSQWKKNTEEEALLGVSLTGIMDNELMSGSNGKTELRETLARLKDHAISINKEWAGKLGINPATAITCNKPSGTVSQLADCASGIHSRYSEYYIRTVRADNKDPLARMMIEMGFPYEQDLMNKEQYVFSFPIKSPSGSITNETMTALEHLEIWKIYQNNWCEHKPSCTIHIKEAEWMEVGAWVYRNFDDVSGIAFLPAISHIYKQAPYQPCTKEEYEKALALMPKDVDWSKLKNYESDDSSVNHKEYVCTGNGSCELVDLVKK